MHPKFVMYAEHITRCAHRYAQDAADGELDYIRHNSLTFMRAALTGIIRMIDEELATITDPRGGFDSERGRALRSGEIQRPKAGVTPADLEV